MSFPKSRKVVSMGTGEHVNEYMLKGYGTYIYLCKITFIGFLTVYNTEKL